MGGGQQFGGAEICQGSHDGQTQNTAQQMDGHAQTAGAAQSPGTGDGVGIGSQIIPGGQGQSGQLGIFTDQIQVTADILRGERDANLARSRLSVSMKSVPVRTGVTFRLPHRETMPAAEERILA